MKIRDATFENDLTVKGDLIVTGDITISAETDNGYIIRLPIKKNPNFFQRLLYKILGLEVIKK